MSELGVDVFATPEALAAGVAERLLDALPILPGEAVHLALTGGTIADAVHREVARRWAERAVAWDRVHVWWGDERFVASDDPDRNALQARRALLDRLPVPAARIHEMPAADRSVSVTDAAAAHAAELERYWPGRFDLVMLGIGPDGHVASLFPGLPGVGERSSLVCAVTDSPKPPPQRISLTLPALNRADSVWFLASGSAKAHAVATALAEASQTRAEASQTPVEASQTRGEASEMLPAARVSGLSSTMWFVDQDAAALIG